MWKYVYVLFFIAVVGVKADKAVTVDDITTQVKGQSGKIAVYRGTNESDGITITYDAIKEVDTNGEDIQSHSFNNFAQLTFTFSDVENTTYADTNVSVSQFSFTADITNDGNTATLTSYVYIFKDDGNITVDGEDFEVSEGMMKFNVKVESWSFCDTCTHGNKDLTGEFLDVYIEIKGKQTPNKTENSNAYDLGDGATVVIPKEVTYDGTTTKDMPTGYPMLDTKGVKNTFVFRFEKFTASALYDPTVKLEEGETGGENGGETGETTEEPSTEEKAMEFEGVSAKVKGQSGKITLARTGQTSDTPKSITVEFDNLKEKKADGNTVKDNQHTYNGFASQDFTFSDPMDAKYPNTELDVVKLTFDADLNNQANLKVYLYIFKEDGEVTQDDETKDVKAGNIKFNVEITNWAFCDGTAMCTQSETGEFLDFEIVMKGSTGASKEASTSGDQYEMGSGSVWLSGKVSVDGAIQDMATGYPRLEKKGSRDVFQFRFPKFSNKVIYDPLASLDRNGSSAASASLVSVLTMALCALLKNMLNDN